MLRKFSVEDYGAIEVEDRLGDISQPVLVVAGRHDRTFVEENEGYVATVGAFMDRHTAAG